jgi:hypothetical protein
MANSLASPSQSIVTIALIVLVTGVSFYVMYHLYKIIMKTDLRTVTLLKNAIKVPQYRKVNINADVTMPSLYNGAEFSYSAWMYIESFNRTGKPQLVLYNGKGDSFSETVSPVFYLDPEYVTLHVLLSTNKGTRLDASSYRGSLENLHKFRDCDFVRLSVDYVPMQRWVNVALVVDNEYVQLFFDGELRKVIDITDKELIENIHSDIQHSGDQTESNEFCENGNVCCKSENTCCGKRLMNTNTGKQLYIGKIGTDEVFNGYLSKVQFFNYAITVDHAKIIYKSGPLHQSMLGRIGLPMYGLRNPFYKIDTSDVNESDEAATA